MRNQDHVDAVAREIKKYYVERKNSAFNKKFKLHGKHAEFTHWQRAADLCLELQATPEVFVDAVFDGCKSPLGPFPNALYGNMARKWYQTYIANKSGYTQAKKELESAGTDVMFGDALNIHTYNLKYDVELVHRSLIRLTGTSEVNSVTIEYINSLTTSYPAHVRVLLGFGNEKVKLFFGEEALNYYNARPHMYRAAEALGYPIKKIIVWLNAQKN
jgi:hypothetical protein